MVPKESGAEDMEVRSRPWGMDAPWAGTPLDKQSGSNYSRELRDEVLPSLQ